mgnify:FL=1
MALVNKENCIHYSQCPVCSSSNFAEVLQCKDYTVSQEQFSIVECQQCTLRFTQDVPKQSHIGVYYQSDNYISHSDTNEGLISKLYKAVRKITLKTKLNIVETNVSSKSGHAILDIGSGTGAFLNTMKQADWSVVGLEPDAGARANALKLYNLTAQAPEQLFLLPSNTFDAITMWHVLEHVEQLQEYIAQCYELLTPGGTLFIAVPNYTSSDARKYQSYWAAYDVPRHLYHFSPNAIKTLVEKHGFYVKRMLPMWFDPFYISMLSEQYQTGSNKLFSAFFAGLKSTLTTIGNKEKASSIIYVIKKN